MVWWRGEKMGEWVNELVGEGGGDDLGMFGGYYEVREEEKD